MQSEVPLLRAFAPMFWEVPQRLPIMLLPSSCRSRANCGKGANYERQAPRINRPARPLQLRPRGALQVMWA